MFPTLFPFLGQKLKNHILVNNWSNGWVLGKDSAQESKIVIIFWPQYLEYLGFLFLFVYYLFLLILNFPPLQLRAGMWYTKSKMPDNTKQVGEIVLEKDDEGRSGKDPAASPAVQDEESASGSAPDVRSDDDVGEMVRQIAGREPEPGETLADIINEAEKELHRPPEEPKEKEQ
jgi:hypothetical protein